MTAPAKPPRSPARKDYCPHRDPLGYANRPLEKSFDPYRALHDHVRKLNAGLKGRAA